MSTFFTTVGVLTWLVSIFAYTTANGAPQQSIGAQLFIAAAILTVGGQVVSHLREIQKSVSRPAGEEKTASKSDLFFRGQA